MPDVRTSDEVSAFYRRRLEEIRRAGAVRQAEKKRITAAVLLCAVVCAVFIGRPWIAVSVGCGLLYLLRRRILAQHAALDLARREKHAEEGLLRVSGGWDSGFTGLEYTPRNHPFAIDLGVVGERSLYGLLCTARTETGRRRLAEFLLEHPTVYHAEARQKRVQQLAFQAELREDIAVLGDHDAQECRSGAFDEWFALPGARSNRGLIWLARAGTVVLSSLLLAVAFQLAPWNAPLIAWTTLLSWTGGAIAVQVALGLILRPRVSAWLEVSRQTEGDLRICLAGLELIGPALNLKPVRKLSTLLSGLNSTLSSLFESAGKLVLLDVHVGFMISGWRSRHGELLRACLREWAEFEAVMAVANYAFEHPENVLPVFSSGRGVFRAAGLAHPLLPRQTAVRNDLGFDSDRRFFIISGSNMAGKSTLLRSIGMMAVLAGAGAPVCAAAATLTVPRLHASLGTLDSLADSKSRFLAESERVRNALRDARNGEPVLFLIDELLGGTNSRDRRIAAELLIRALVEAGAIGAVSTHDLALTEIAHSLPGANVHMSCVGDEHPLEFDYRLKPGIYEGSNALAIVRLVLEATPERPELIPPRSSGLPE